LHFRVQHPAATKAAGVQEGRPWVSTFAFYALPFDLLFALCLLRFALLFSLLPFAF
jgi:hypothetical protein